jgi:hypothetical protein
VGVQLVSNLKILIDLLVGSSKEWKTSTLLGSSMVTSNPATYSLGSLSKRVQAPASSVELQSNKDSFPRTDTIRTKLSWI